MKLIVGLGNPGRQYSDTPHNIGFHTLDLLADRWNAGWALERRFEAETCEVPAGPGGARLTLMKPQTFMNLSGRSVAPFCQKNGVDPADVLVVSDDLHLALGRLRMRPGGSHGGQKGLMNIIQALGTMDVPRLRLGITPEGVTVRDNSAFVLGKVRPADRELWLLAQQTGADAVEHSAKHGLMAAMNKFNGPGVV